MRRPLAASPVVRRPLAVVVALALGGAAPVPDLAADARALDALIAANYAYPERLPDGVPPRSATLDAARAQVRDERTLLRYVEDRIASLADHHAIAGRAFADSWAVVPSYADLWIVPDRGGFAVAAVRTGSPAATAGIVAGDRLVAIEGAATDDAVSAFWARLGLAVTEERAGYAARVLAAGRRDRPRRLTIAHAGVAREFALENLYGSEPDRPPVSVATSGSTTTVRFHNSLGDDATVAAFDAAMAAIPPRQHLVIDLTDTPSGGNTSVARGVMGWFARRPTGYQVHRLYAEEARTGIVRQWIEQVLPRPGRHRAGRVTVLVGRWTGSMGEGLAIGLRALGARVEGDRMAGLRGAIYDFTLPESGIVVKLPAERLTTVDGIPREAFVPRRR